MGRIHGRRAYAEPGVYEARRVVHAHVDGRGYFMPIVQGLVVADRFAVWELDEPSR